jgi:hypothetical protein
MDKLDLDPMKWLWPEELKLVCWLIHTHELAFTWEAAERGHLDKRYFPPYKIPTMPHMPQSHCNIPVPPLTMNKVMCIIKEKIDSGMYEPSTSSYRSCWFCVIKKDGKLLHLVHDLQPLNVVTVHDMLQPPFIEHLVESFAGYAVYSMLDLYSGYNQRTLHIDSRDLTMFSMPLGLHQLTTLPQGHTNACQVFHGDIIFILKDEIPRYMLPFMDDIVVKTMQMRYERSDSTYKTILENPGIRWFIWEHCVVMHHILQCLKNIGVTISTTKFVIAAPSAVIIGHKCTFEGRVPEDTKVQKIHNWPIPTNQSQVHRYLGTCGVLHIFICNFVHIARLLTNLTRKDVPFVFGPDEIKAFKILRDSILESPALCHIDYESDCKVILAVDTSNIAIGFILMQVSIDRKQYPNRFSSIVLNDIESRYSQAKLELYGLFRTLHTVCIFIFGVKCLTVKVDAKYIKGMINNPNLQPNATINQWIAGILLFSFKLVHIPVTKHKGVDGLSRRLPADDDHLEEEDDHEDWIDCAYLFRIAVLNDRTYHISGGSAEIIHHAHNHCYTSQVVCAPVHRIFLDVIQNESPEPSILRSETALALDASLIRTQEFLITRERPPDLSDHKFAVFINYTTHFFILEDTLWCREPHG